MTSIVFRPQEKGQRWAIFRNGVQVGRIVRYDHTNKSSTYGLFIDGIYWRGGQATRNGGSTGVPCTRIREAKALAETTIIRHDIGLPSHGIQ